MKRILLNTVKTLMLPVILYCIFLCISFDRFSNWNCVYTIFLQSIIPTITAYAVAYGNICGVFDFTVGSAQIISGVIGGLCAAKFGFVGMLLGAFAALYQHHGIGLGVYFIGILPHGIFELPALILAFATGLYVCGQVTRLCRRDKEALHVWDCLLLMSRVLFLALLPLLAAAAVVEAYVTPLVASLFL